MKRFGHLSILGVVLFLWITFPLGQLARAQSVRGGIAGTITDTTGAVIPNATIVATNVSTGDKITTRSTSAGAYRIPEMPLGVYDLTVSSPGFQKATYSGIRVTVNSTIGQDVQLQAGSATQTVTVQANALALQTESSDLSGTVSEQQITELPLALGGVGALRSPQAFVFLLPGATGPGSGGGSGASGVQLMKIGGGQSLGSNVLLDGATMSRNTNGSNFDETAPSVEAIREFKVTTSIPEAEYGRTTGGIQSFVTKSGSNQYHGSVFDIIRNEDMDANSWFNNGYSAMNCVGAANTPACRALYARPKDTQNDYGGSLGGYVRIPHVYDGKDKTFFFFSWEQFRQTHGASLTSTVPTALERQGDFSEVLQTASPAGINPCTGQQTYVGEIFDPETTQTVNGVPCRTPFPDNKIPEDRFSSVSKNILKFYPEPTNGNLARNFTYPSSYPLTNTTYTARVDQSFGSSRIFFSYSTRQNTRLTANPALPDPVAPNEFNQNFVTHYGRFGWDYIFSPTLLNHLNFGTNRQNGKNYAYGALHDVNYAQEAGLSNINSTLFPIIGVGNGITGLGAGNSANNIDNSLVLDDSISWEKGRHSFKFGGTVMYFQQTGLTIPKGTFNFANGQTAASSTSTSIANTGYGFASFLLGDVQGASTQQFADQPQWTHWYYAGFAQDDMKVSSNLVLNLGVRYEVEPAKREIHNLTSNFSPTAIDPEYGIPGALIFGPQCHCNTKWADTWMKDVGPRAGFAWTPGALHNRTTLRGGAGILYAPMQYLANETADMRTGYSASPNPTSGDKFSPAFNWDSGFPAFQAPPILDPGYFNGGPLSANYMQPTAGRPGTVYNWSLQVQQQLASDTILTIGYDGMRASNLNSDLQNINNISPSDFALGNELSSPIATAGVSEPFAGFTALWGGPKKAQVQQALRPFPQYGAIGSACCLQNLGHASYDALLVSLQKSFRNGLQYLVSYTWAKDITNADSINPGTNAGVQGIQNPDDLKQEKSLSMQDIPHTLVFSYLYQLPFGRGRRFLNSSNTIVNTFLGGWEIGGIQRYMSGIPISFGCASGIPGWDNCVRYSFTGNPIKSAVERKQKLNPFFIPHGADPNLNSLFNGAVYGSQTAANQTDPAFFDQNNVNYRGTGAYTLGTVPRVTGADRMNPFLNEDFSLIKRFQIREGTSFMLKFEALNALNRHAWATPNVQPSALLFGVPAGTMENPRQCQITGRITF